jgi:hypothetical protein
MKNERRDDQVIPPSVLPNENAGYIFLALSVAGAVESAAGAAALSVMAGAGMAGAALSAAGTASSVLGPQAATNSTAAAKARRFILLSMGMWGATREILASESRLAG